ncbi:MAG TPA: hypothetical protein VED85_02420, partial [Burkholderiaceae bacterium]|nr:hypothetical protein [Burkholderiaceae bacterium]
ITPREVPTAEIEAYLRPLQLRQTEELASLLRRGFPEWTTLYGTARAFELVRGQKESAVLSEGELRVFTAQRMGRR